MQVEEYMVIHKALLVVEEHSDKRLTLFWQVEL